MSRQSIGTTRVIKSSPNSSNYKVKKHLILEFDLRLLPDGAFKKYRRLGTEFYLAEFDVRLTSESVVSLEFIYEDTIMKKESAAYVDHSASSSLSEPVKHDSWLRLPVPQQLTTKAIKQDLHIGSSNQVLVNSNWATGTLRKAQLAAPSLVNVSHPELPSRPSSSYAGSLFSEAWQGRSMTDQTSVLDVDLLDPFAKPYTTGPLSSQSDAAHCHEASTIFISTTFHRSNSSAFENDAKSLLELVYPSSLILNVFRNLTHFHDLYCQSDPVMSGMWKAITTVDVGYNIPPKGTVQFIGLLEINSSHDLYLSNELNGISSRELL